MTLGSEPFLLVALAPGAFPKCTALSPGGHLGPGICVLAIGGLQACVPDWEHDPDPGGGTGEAVVKGGSWDPRPCGHTRRVLEPCVSRAGRAGCDFPLDATLISLATKDGKQCGQITG